MQRSENVESAAGPAAGAFWDFGGPSLAAGLLSTLLLLALYAFLEWQGALLLVADTKSAWPALILAFIWAAELPATWLLNRASRAAGVPTAFPVWSVFVLYVMRTAIASLFLMRPAMAYDADGRYAETIVGVVVGSVMLKEALSLLTFFLKSDAPVSRPWSVAAELCVIAYSAVSLSILRLLLEDMAPGGMDVFENPKMIIPALLIVLLFAGFYVSTHTHRIRLFVLHGKPAAAALVFGPALLMLGPLFYSHADYMEVVRAELRNCRPAMDLSGRQLGRLEQYEWKPLCNCDQLQILNLSDNNMEAGPNCLRDLDSLRALDLSRNRITPYLLHNVLVNLPPKLEILDLRSIHVYKLPHNLVRIRRHPELRVLGLSRTAIAGSGFANWEENLQHFRNLEELHLMEREFGPEEKERLRAALPGVEVFFGNHDDMQPLYADMDF